MDTSTLPYIRRSQSENTALSTHTFNRLQGSSSLVPQPSASAKMGSHLASKQYVEQHRSFVEHQRNLHDEERLLWQLERDELHERIHELERMVRSLGGQVDSTFHASHRGSSVSTHVSEHLSTVSSSTSAGDEFWRGAGGLNGAHTTRTFSEPTVRASSTSANTHHLPSIAERPEIGPRKKSVGFSTGQPSVIGQDFYVHPIPTVPVRHRKSDLDGITFKPSILSVNGMNKPSRSQSQSPKQSRPTDPAGAPMERVPSSEAREPKPQVIDLPSSGLTASALLVKDAGHTPLARMSDPDVDHSAGGTPKLQSQNPVVENEALPAKLPSERAQSYFPVVDEVTQLPPVEDPEVRNEEPTDDPALKGPLALTSDPNSHENSGFLSALDSKLLEAQKTAKEPEASENGSVSDMRAKDKTDTTALDAEEQEPKLKIKRSMNFGSVFGSGTVGRNL